MKKTMLLLVLTVFLTGCGHMNSTISECPGANGKDVTIRYGDSRIEVTHKVKVKRDEKIVLKLQFEQNPASGTDYENLEIELKGKTSSASWLNRKVKASDGDKKKTICVDNQAAGDYEYKVEVPGVGVIDPRVEVIEL